MAEGSVKFPCQTPMTCDMCDAQYDVLWYCNTCVGNLCTECKENHGNKKIFQKHIVISLTEALRQKSEIKEACVKHQNNFYTISCNDCHTLICSDCVVEEHNGHKLGKIPEVMESICKELQEYADTLETDLLAQCRTEEGNISLTAKNCQTWLANIKSLVQKQQEDLKAEIDHYCYSILLTAQNESDNQMSELDQVREKIKSTVSEINQLQMKTKELQGKRNSETIQFQREKLSLSNIEVPRFTSLTLPTFQLGKIDSKLLKEQIGTFQKTEIKKQKPPSDIKTQKVPPEIGTSEIKTQMQPPEIKPPSEIKPQKPPSEIKPQKPPSEIKPQKPAAVQKPVAVTHSKQFTDKQEVDVTEMQIVGTYKSRFIIGSILTVGKNQAWISFPGIKRISLVQVAEFQYEVKEINTSFDIEDIVFLASGRIMATQHKGTSIKTFTQAGGVTDTFNTAPYQPTGICLTNKQQSVAVCITDQYNSVKLVIYSLVGKIQEEIPYTYKKVNSPYGHQRVKQSQNGDFSILNSYLQTVFVVDFSGVNKFSYNGSRVSGLTRPFKPSDICYNSCDQLLITDHVNNVIHIVDQLGSIITFVNTDKLNIQIPRALNVDTDGKVWIGHGTSLSVMKF